MRHLVFSALGLGLAAGVFCSPALSTRLLSAPVPVQERLVTLQQQAQDHRLCVDEVLDQISASSKS